MQEEVKFTEESGRQSPDILLREVEEHRKLLLSLTCQIRSLSSSEKYAANSNLHHSGNKKNDGEMTFRGQETLKKCIIESAWIAARRDPALSLAYHKNVKRMEANNAIIRIARKLSNRIYFVLKNKK